MKLKNFLISSAIMAIAGLAMVGCNENTIDPGPTGTAPKSPTSLQAVSKNVNTVGLKWNAAVDTVTVTDYEVSYTSATSSSTTTVGGTTLAADFTNLPAGEITFSVKARHFTSSTTPDTLKSAATTVHWAAATRFTQDAGSASQAIKIFEKSSSSGSAIILDPGKGGPKNVSVIDGGGALTNVQLAMSISATGDTLSIGPAYAFLNLYANVNQFDQNVYISSTTQVISSLNTWYMSASLETLINNSQGNVSTFDFPGAASVSGILNQGFIVRTGATGSYHYARVMLVNKSGGYIQGTKPNRFIELEISYQTTANLPFAKPAGQADSPIGVYSHRVR